MLTCRFTAGKKLDVKTFLFSRAIVQVWHGIGRTKSLKISKEPHIFWPRDGHKAEHSEGIYAPKIYAPNLSSDGKQSTVVGHIYEDLGQTFLTKIKVSGIYCSPANEDIAMNPMANSPNFILRLRKIFSDFSINHFYFELIID